MRQAAAATAAGEPAHLENFMTGEPRKHMKTNRTFYGRLTAALAMLFLAPGVQTPVRAYPPAPASQAQVNAGTEPYLYVTPATLAGKTGGGGGGSNAALATNALALNGVPSSGFKMWITNFNQLTNLFFSMPPNTSRTNMPCYEFDFSNVVIDCGNVSLVETSTYPNNLVFHGLGSYASDLVYRGTNDFIKLVYTQSSPLSNEMNLEFDGICVGGVSDSPYHLMHIIGPGKNLIENCNFVSWTNVTQNSLFGFGANDGAPGNGPSAVNMSGIWLDGGAGTFTKISDCNFNYLHQGITDNADHLFLINDSAATCGADNNGPNFWNTQWPTNSDNWCGGFIELGGGGTIILQVTAYGLHPIGCYADVILNALPQYEAAIYDMQDENANNENGNNTEYAVAEKTSLTNLPANLTFFGGFGISQYGGEVFYNSMIELSGTNVIQVNPPNIDYVGRPDNGAGYQLPDSGVTTRGSITANSFSGNGSGLTSIPATATNRPDKRIILWNFNVSH